MIGVWVVLKRFGRALRRGIGDPAFRGVLSLTSAVIASGAVFYRWVEGWGWVDSIYFTVITLTTVGYGDLSPTTAASKVFTVVLVLLGIGLLVTLVERIARYAIEDQVERRSRDTTP